MHQSQRMEWLTSNTDTAWAAGIRGFLESAYSLETNTRRRAMARIADSLHASPESPVDALQMVFTKSNDDGKALFRSALGIVMSDAHPDTFPGQAAIDVVYLMGYSEAIESLPKLADTIGDIADWGDLHEELFVNALSILKGLGKSSYAYKTTRRLATSPLFPKHLALDAYEALVIGEPSCWAMDFLDFEPLLCQMRENPERVNRYSSQEWFKIRINYIAREVVGACSLATIADGLDEVERSSSQLDATRPLGDLILSLFGCDGVFLRGWQNNREYFSFRGRREPWREHWNSLSYFLSGVNGSRNPVKISEADLPISNSIDELLRGIFSHQSYRSPVASGCELELI